MQHPWVDELSVAISAVRKASEICQAVQAAITPEVLDKKDNSPVTIADFASQAVVCQLLAGSFPEDSVIAEEDSFALMQPENAGFLRDVCDLLQRHGYNASANEICRWIDHGGAKASSDRFWTLDPIDGTKGFLRGDQYAVSLALIVDGDLKVGALGCPNLGPRFQNNHTLFYAVRGHGAYVTDASATASPQQLHVTRTCDSTLARFCESFESGHSSHSASAEIAEKLGITAAPLRMDSQAKYAAVADGNAEAYLRLPSKPGYFEKIWDHAGGVLVVEEAGGRVTDLAGNSLDFSRGSELKKNRGVIVTNGLLHDQILCAANAVLADCGAR